MEDADKRPEDEEDEGEGDDPADDPNQDDAEAGEEDDDDEGDDLQLGGAEDVGNITEELESLISFQNLASVIKHIISKFKKIESKNDRIDDEIAELKRELESRATNSSLDEVGSQLGAQLESCNHQLQAQKESITGLEDALERNKVLCSTIDKKLETTSKEKTVQDRLIREIQDSLQDKVAVAELNMFEAKFAGYTTKVEHQEVIHMLNDYTRVDVTERVAENVKSLHNRFEDYSRTAKIEEWLQDLRDWVNTELLNYAKAEKTYQKMTDLGNEIKDQQVTVERSFNLMDDKVRGLADRVTSIYVELNDDLHKRALHTHLEAVQNDLKNYALRSETDSFQQDCVPKLKFCVDSIQAFDERLKAQDGAIQRVDEVLLDKASKYDIVVANSRIEQCMNKDRAMKEFQKMYERLEWMTKRLEHYVATETDRFNQFKPPDYTQTFEDINNRLSLKADKADLVDLYQLKANRIDNDELAKQQDTIHRQLEYLAITSFGLSKLVLTEAKSGESKTIRQQQKSQVLMQSEALWHWILHNEPPPNLDTLKSPASKRNKAAESEGNAQTPFGNDKAKRAKDEQKRHQLEVKLGIQADM
eukprot:gnl/MRDRNA2_/MRDRNA2_91868_c0_seq1.p1 gnl/MRDRNA2_/MRDRNA2_91868_c0~~gnl/MRDRNA2_/MRDRNA2_91868_c0_seq1.p1  ORF type:complete len:611 (-),score=159.67 gnl/MRDRNA2_/MRDRNA2_91868_c0_seq1:29-1795(-)